MKVSRAVIAHVSAAMRAALDRDAPDSDEGQALAAAAVLAVTLHQTFGKDGRERALGLVERSTRAYFGVIDEAEHEV